MNIQEERKKRNLTLAEMGELLGVSARTVEAWEQGRRNPSKQVIMLIENGALDVKPEE